MVVGHPLDTIKVNHFEPCSHVTTQKCHRRGGGFSRDDASKDLHFPRHPKGEFSLGRNVFVDFSLCSSPTLILNEKLKELADTCEFLR